MLFKVDYDLTLTGIGDGKIGLGDRLWVKWCIAKAAWRLLWTDVAKFPIERVGGKLAGFTPPPGAVMVGDLKTLGAPVPGDDCDCPLCTMRRAIGAATGKTAKPDKSKMH